LWPSFAPAAAGANLRRTLHVARRVLGVAAGTADFDHLLTRRGDRLFLDPEDVSTDVEDFQARAAGARRSQLVAEYEAALALYAGDLLPQDRYEEWAVG